MTRKTKRLILHIGVEKTGTTSLQQSLCESTSLLKSLDIGYPNSLRQRPDYSHKLLAAAFVPFKRRSFVHAENRGINSADLLESLSAELRAKKASTVIISSEHLHSRFHSESECVGLVRALADVGLNDITLVVYLRRQDQLIQAAYREAVRWGFSDSPEAVVANIESRRGLFGFANYEVLLKRWSAAVGKENIVPRIYDRDLLSGGSTELDFMTWLRPGADIASLRRPEANQSWSAEVTQYIARINATWKDKPLHTALLKRNKLAKDLGQLQGVGGKHIFTPEERRSIREAFATSNAKVAADFFPDAEGGLFGSTAPDSQAAAHRLDDARFDEITAALPAPRA